MIILPLTILAGSVDTSTVRGRHGPLVEGAAECRAPEKTRGLEIDDDCGW